MGSSFTFKYPAKEGVNDVILVGNFDNWAGRLPLIKTKSGWELQVPLKGPKVEFKFIVDGDWVTSDQYATISDDSGNVNNIIEVTEETAQTKVAHIPESGGLATPIVAEKKVQEGETPPVSSVDNTIDTTATATTDKPVEASEDNVKYVKKVKKKVPVEKSGGFKAKLKNLFS